MARSAEMRRGDMEEAKKENETLIPALEDAETVKMSTEEREAVQAEAETLTSSQAETITLDEETVKVGLGAEQVGTPEVPKNLETGDGYREDFVDNTTEVIDPMAKAKMMPEVEQKDIDLGEPVGMAPVSLEEFQAMMANVETLGRQEMRVGTGSISDVTYEQYTQWFDELEQMKKQPKPGFFARMMKSMKMGSEFKRENDLQDKINAVEELRADLEAEFYTHEGDGDYATGAKQRQAERAKRAKKSGTGGFGR